MLTTVSADQKSSGPKLDSSFYTDIIPPLKHQYVPERFWIVQQQNKFPIPSVM